MLRRRRTLYADDRASTSMGNLWYFFFFFFNFWIIYFCFKFLYLFYLHAQKIAYSKSKSDSVARKDGTFVPRPKRTREETTSGASTAAHSADEKISSSQPPSKMQKLLVNNVPHRILFAQALPEDCTHETLRTLFSPYPGFQEVIRIFIKSWKSSYFKIIFLKLLHLRCAWSLARKISPSLSFRRLFRLVSLCSSWEASSLTPQIRFILRMETSNSTTR